MNNNLPAVLLLVWVPFLGRAQRKIETDRPTETLSAKLVGKGSFQVETGVRKDQQNNTDYNTKHPDIEWRYGLLNQLELRLSTITETQRFPSKSKTAYGLLPIELGLKAGLYQNRDTSFLVTAYGHVGIRQWASKDHQPNKSFYRIRLLLQNEFTNKFGVQYNLGRDWMGDDEEQAWVYAVAPHLDLSDKWQAFVESHGWLKKGGEPEHYLSAGLAYFISNNVEVDANVGKGLNSQSANYFVTAGFSFRLR